jgi:hypothetical protein
MVRGAEVRPDFDWDLICRNALPAEITDANGC